MLKISGEELPGEELDTAGYPHVVDEGNVALLWSVYGVEGVYTDMNALVHRVRDLQKMAAYRDEMFNYQFVTLNG